MGALVQERHHKPLAEHILTLSQVAKKAPPLRGTPTGIPGFDNLFFKVEWKDGKPVRKPLGGVPEYAVINITGMPDTGKSLMVEQFAVTQASVGNKVCFVTVESPAPFVASGLKERATAMGIDFSAIEDNIVLVDAGSDARLREDIPTLLDTLALAYKRHSCTRTVVDSVTGLYEAKEMLARSVVRALFQFMKKWHQTAIFVSQKRSGHDELSAEAAGGYAVGHIVDCTVVLSKEVVMSTAKARTFHVQLGEVVRMLRIDGCRLCGHDTSLHILHINELGIVEVKGAVA